MKITQEFRSSKDERVISEIEIGGADQATPIPSTTRTSLRANSAKSHTRVFRLSILSLPSGHGKA
jgi:hypothetical protein